MSRLQGVEKVHNVKYAWYIRLRFSKLFRRHLRKWNDYDIKVWRKDAHCNFERLQVTFSPKSLCVNCQIPWWDKTVSFSILCSASWCCITFAEPRLLSPTSEACISITSFDMHITCFVLLGYEEHFLVPFSDFQVLCLPHGVDDFACISTGNSNRAQNSLSFRS